MARPLLPGILGGPQKVYFLTEAVADDMPVGLILNDPRGDGPVVAITDPEALRAASDAYFTDLPPATWQRLSRVVDRFPFGSGRISQRTVATLLWADGREAIFGCHVTHCPGGPGFRQDLRGLPAIGRPARQTSGSHEPGHGGYMAEVARIKADPDRIFIGPLLESRHPYRGTVPVHIPGLILPINMPDAEERVAAHAKAMADALRANMPPEGTVWTLGDPVLTTLRGMPLVNADVGGEVLDADGHPIWLHGLDFHGLTFVAKGDEALVEIVRTAMPELGLDSASLSHLEAAIADTLANTVPHLNRADVQIDYMFDWPQRTEIGAFRPETYALQWYQLAPSAAGNGH